MIPNSMIGLFAAQCVLLGILLGFELCRFMTTGHL
jgi:hypothetical protein